MHGMGEKLALHQQTDSFNREKKTNKKHDPKTKNRQTPRFFYF